MANYEYEISRHFEQETITRHKPIVIKLGGSTLEERADTLKAVAELYRSFYPVILVHGGGNDIDQAVRRQGMQPVKVNGKRVTDEKTLAIVQQEMVRVNNELVTQLQNTYSVISAGFIAAGVLAEQDATLGYVGKNPVIRKSLFQASLSIGQTPVVAPLAADVTNLQDLNTNADDVAAAIAKEFTSLLVIATNVPGVIKDGEVIQQFSEEDIHTVSGGMIPKVQACLEVTRAGGKAIICQPSAIIANVLEGKHLGTYFA